MNITKTILIIYYGIHTGFIVPTLRGKIKITDIETTIK